MDKDCLHIVFFVTGTDRASDMKLLKTSRHALLSVPQTTMDESSSKEENTNFKRNNNVSENSGKCF